MQSWISALAGRLLDHVNSGGCPMSTVYPLRGLSRALTTLCAIVMMRGKLDPARSDLRHHMLRGGVV